MPQKNENCHLETADFVAVLKESEQVIKDCFDQYDLDQVFLAFNGGKDCTVLLDIVINYIQKAKRNINEYTNLKVVYIKTKDPFKEIELFVDVIKKHYALNLMTVEGDMKYALERILNEDTKLKACFMGTRRVDPHGADLNFMQETDANWPQIMRVSPLLNWSYHQIWSYIHTQKVPYCQLYDKGYTSIGSILNTRPNPALAYTDTSNQILYLPAWKLKDPSQERDGRIINGHSQNSVNDHDYGHTLTNGNSHNKEDTHQNSSEGSGSFQADRNCL